MQPMLHVRRWLENSSDGQVSPAVVACVQHKLYATVIEFSIRPHAIV